MLAMRPLLPRDGESMRVVRVVNPGGAGDADGAKLQCHSLQIQRVYQMFWAEASSMEQGAS